MNQQIQVSVIVRPLPETCTKDSVGKIIACRKTLGKSNTTRHPASKDGGPVFLYPQAVLTQHIPPNRRPYFVDMILEFNSEVDWYFPQEIAPFTIKNSKYDFECNLFLTLVHAVRQISKGLGFSTGLSSHRTSENIPYLAPMVLTTKNPIDPSHNSTFFSPLNAFDSLVTTGDALLPDKVFPMTTMQIVRDISYNNFVKMFESLVIPSTCGKQLYQTLTTYGARINIGLAFLPLMFEDNGGDLGVNVPTLPGHEPEDIIFSTRTTREPGISLQLEMLKRAATSVYGPQILHVYEKIGFCTINNYIVCNPKFEISDLPTREMQSFVPIPIQNYPGTYDQYLYDNYEPIRVTPSLFHDGQPLGDLDLKFWDRQPQVQQQLPDDLEDIFDPIRSESELFESGTALGGERQAFPD